ncbi:MAG TPA: hypothetical protein VJR26_03375 [Candidatus Acidoferrales bacterium]|nr:hypothetical protein [Candidatus Acidoferrales bacterium]
MSHNLEALPPSKSSPTAENRWTDEEEAAFTAIIEDLKRRYYRAPEEDFVTNVRRAVMHALHNFGVRREPMIPFMERGSAINRILGKCRHRLLGPKRTK